MTGIAPIRSLSARPILLLAAVSGGAAALGLSFIPNSLPTGLRPLLGWDLGALIYIAGTFWTMRAAAPGDMARRAARTDEARHFFLWLCVFAAALSVWAIALEFHAAQTEHGAAKAEHIALAVVTVVLSWLFTHTVFATHYAHEYFDAGAKKGQPAGGLKFPGGESAPDWWDFVHFALVIGVAAQTADVAIESRTMRRTATWHGVVAFVFNTVIVAFTVNLATSLL